jgi:hypothetical protein
MVQSQLHHQLEPTAISVDQLAQLWHVVLAIVHGNCPEGKLAALSS